MDTNDTLHAKILSLSEANTLKKPVPYSYVLGTGSQKLYMLGVAHFKTPDNPQFAQLRELWDQFNALTTPKIALLESGIGPVAITFDDAVRTGGEQGATQWLALQDCIGVHVADLDFDEQVRTLSHQFGADKVGYFFVAYSMWNSIRRDPQRDASRQLVTVLHRFRKSFIPLGQAMDDAWFKNTHEAMFPGQPIEDNGFWTRLLSTSAPQFMSDILSEGARIRNNRLFDVIQHFWDAGFSVFITYGCNHSWELEPALRQLVG